jgi:hypothetical protein
MARHGYGHLLPKPGRTIPLYPACVAYPHGEGVSSRGMSSPLTRWLALGALVLLPACDLNINRTGGNSEKGYFEIEPT